MPGGLAVPVSTAADVLKRRFPARLHADAARLLGALPAAGVFGGAAHDRLVGLQAGAHGHVLLTPERRAEETYAGLGVPFERVS